MNRNSLFKIGIAGCLFLLAGCAAMKDKNQEAAEAPWTGSNLEQPYPMFSCLEPLPPGDGFMGQAAFYVYKQQALAYRKCMHDYIKNAQHDIETIKQKMEGAEFDLRIAEINGLPDANDFGFGL